VWEASTLRLKETIEGPAVDAFWSETVAYILKIFVIFSRVGGLCVVIVSDLGC
jgi:hypothetical protein